jgi:hypothetical protein
LAACVNAATGPLVPSMVIATIIKIVNRGVVIIEYYYV